MGVEIKTNSAQLKLEFWLSLAINVRLKRVEMVTGSKKAPSLKPNEFDS